HMQAPALPRRETSLLLFNDLKLMVPVPALREPRFGTEYTNWRAISSPSSSRVSRGPLAGRAADGKSGIPPARLAVCRCMHRTRAPEARTGGDGLSGRPRPAWDAQLRRGARRGNAGIWSAPDREQR